MLFPKLILIPLFSFFLSFVFCIEVFSQKSNEFEVSVSDGEIYLIRPALNDTIWFNYSIGNLGNHTEIINNARMRGSEKCDLEFETNKKDHYGIQRISDIKVVLFKSESKVLFKNVQFQGEDIWLPLSMIKLNQFNQMKEFRFFYLNVENVRST